jgi:protein-L-isoaspartate(D-aspartate) O-methyltransferase
MGMVEGYSRLIQWRADLGTPLKMFRSFYANHVAATAGVPDVQEPLAAAFDSVCREQFVDKGPWRVLTPVGYIRTPSDDPAFLYQDIVVGIVEEGSINNGQPSLHAICIANMNPRGGETVVQIGAGTGYYTAVLANLVGPNGTVVAYEIDRTLAERAARNLSDLSNVTVYNRSGAVGPLPSCDVIYVNAGATAPLDIWLDALRSEGRLVFPLTPASGTGGMLLVTRKQNGGFSARFITPAMFIPCIGARDETTAGKLTEAFQRGGFDHVKSLYRRMPIDDTCWFCGDGWWLSISAVT